MLATKGETERGHGKQNKFTNIQYQVKCMGENVTSAQNVGGGSYDE